MASANDEHKKLQEEVNLLVPTRVFVTTTQLSKKLAELLNKIDPGPTPPQSTSPKPGM